MDTSPGAGVARGALRDLVVRLEDLARRRVDGRPPSDAARERARRLLDNLAGHVRVRAESLDAPLLVLLLGPTGAGKSSLFNTIAGRAASETGVLRPTTRTAVVLAGPDDAGTLRRGALAGLGPDQVRVVPTSGDAGLAVVDAPDIDSVEHANRALADRLVEAADLCIFVTTATRYADRVPWAVLERVRDRGLPLLVVVNRLPPEAADRREVLADVRRLFVEAGLGDELEILGVAEGAIDRDRQALEPAPVAPVVERIDALRADREARVALAARALAGSLAGLGPLVDEVADDAAHEAIDAAALRRTAASNYERELDDLLDTLRRGTFLREEALRHWQSYVGADDVTRLFSRGIGAVRGAIAGLFRPSRPPIAEVRGATTDDLVAVARLHAADAARRTATAWSAEPLVAPAVAGDPSLWEASPDFDAALRGRIDEWIASIGADIMATGEGKRRLARGASLGVNAIGVGVMLATFAHTAGLTGAEVGVAAATAYLNQKLLSALFGEAAMVELIARARTRLTEALTAAFAAERERFGAIAPDPAELELLASELRATAVEVRALRALP